MGDDLKVWKYARPEFERRFLLATVPPGHVTGRRHIADRYFLGTELRLRVMTDESDEREYKLTKKIPAADGANARLTTMYLSATAYALLAGLPGAELHKTRITLPPFGIDVFEGSLEPLVLAECEAVTAAELAQHSPPPTAIAEVTDDERFTGGRLVRTTADELRALLARFGI